MGLMGIVGVIVCVWYVSTCIRINNGETLHYLTPADQARVREYRCDELRDTKLADLTPNQLDQLRACR